jgi:hypothetical protein
LRRIHDELFDLRVPPEALARWALETPAPAQEATYSAIAFALRTEYAAVALLPAVDLLIHTPGALDPDGFLRQPRGAVEHFKLRSQRATAWMELFIHFRERFPAASSRPPPESLGALAQALTSSRTPLDAAVDLLVRESVVPEIEELFTRTLTYPPLRALLDNTRATEVQRSAEARRLASAVMGPIDGKKLWSVRRRLLTTASRALLGARPLLAQLERGGIKVDRAKAAKNFARRLEEAVGELEGERVVPQALVARLAGLIEKKDQPGE